MERNFTNENFERFLRQNAASLRMRPTAKVWKHISSHLNRRRKIMGLILGVALLSITGLGYYWVDKNLNTSRSLTTGVTNKTNTGETSNKNSGKTTAFISENKKISVPDQRTSVLKEKKTIVKADKSAETFNNPKPGSETVFNFTPTIVDSYYENGLVPKAPSSSSNEIDITDPLTIESIINSFKQKHKSKIGWQAYFTPTVSYRKLSDNYINSVAPHKPAFGFELGLTAKYPLTKNTKLRAGFQFNVNRYEIKTFDSYSQLATVRVNNRNGVNYVRTVTNYNNFTGYHSSWLQNFYFQVSAPIGIELKLKGDDRIEFGVASTVQPTYLLGDKAYVISTDYKNYAKFPTLVRRWNINTNLETFVGYSTGRLKWQVGPQVRYQWLSSYLKKYPVKEHLFDFGLKVGISLNNQ